MLQKNPRYKNINSSMLINLDNKKNNTWFQSILNYLTNKPPLFLQNLFLQGTLQHQPRTACHRRIKKLMRTTKQVKPSLY